MNEVSVQKYLSRGTSATTSDGRRIVFGPNDTRFGGAVQLRVKLELEPDRREKHSDLIRATSRFTDDSGRIWETCDRISVADLYHEAIRRPIFAFASPVKAKAGSTAGAQVDRVETHTLIRDAVIDVDDSEFRPVCVYREKANWQADWDRYEKLIFLMQEKFLYAKVNILERVLTRTAPAVFENRSVHMLVWPEYSPATSTAIAAGGEPITIDRVDYCQLAPLSAEIRLADFLWSSVWRRERDDDVEFWQRESPTMAKCTPTSERGEPTPGVTVQ
ncbi:MAG: hypothetical protein ACKVS9_19140 [Phycisphaerae bacterium]